MNKERIYQIIFEDDTKAGKTFDVVLLLCIVVSVITAILDSVSSFAAHHKLILKGLEWLFTIIFTLEYIIRIYCVRNKPKYIFSFFGIIDLLSIAPTYISLFIPGGHYLMVIRVLRLLRVFRIFKLVRYVKEAQALLQAIAASLPKIIVFFLSVTTLIIIIGTLMYLIEGPEHGFKNIPVSMYWAVVTVTTVGYGDLTPQTALGQTLSSLAMIIGYTIIAVPTGIFSAELVKLHKKNISETMEELHAHKKNHCPTYCPHCGEKIKQ